MTDFEASPLVRRAVREMAPYVPGLQPAPGQRLVKLNTNENPYPPSPRVLERLRATVDGGGLRLYPDPLARELRAAAARLYGLPSEEWVIPGNGSDEILAILVRAFVDEGDTIAYFQPSYSLYPVLAAAVPARVVEIPLGREAGEPPIPSPRARIFFLTTPNAPLGRGFSTSWIARLLAAYGGIVVADEAYVDFADESSLPLLAEHPRLVIARSLSKAYSLAGLRVGLAFAHPLLAAEILKVKDSYNVSRLSQAAAAEALADQPYFRSTRDRILATRARFTARLARAGFMVLPSQANFIFAAVPSPGPAGARPLYERLLARGFLVRYFDRPGIADGLRISIGTDEEMDSIAEAMEREA